MLRIRNFKVVVLAALPFVLAACSEDPASPTGDGDTVASYVSAVTVNDIEGELQSSAIPRPEESGPDLTADGHVTIINGGTATVTLTSPTEFDRVYVAASSPTSRLFVPVAGFYTIELPAPTTNAEVVVAFSQTLPANDFELYFSVADPAGNVGVVAERSFEALSVGTGDIQVALAWDTDADVDLHVVDPGGNEIYWANRQSPTGGQLDLDSNAACAGDNVRNENITWATGTAPVGTYVVRVDYWSSCNASATNYTVLVNNGGEIDIFRGTFTGGGDGGGQGSGRDITTFERASGPQPVAAPPGPATSAVMTKEGWRE